MNVLVELIVVICRFVYCIFEALFRLVIPPPAKQIVGEVAVVTGAGRGIGREIALRLARHGAHVAVCDINESGCDETVRLIVEDGGTARPYRCDVTDIDDVAKMAASVGRELGTVDILVNNAGVLVVRNILELSNEEIRRTMEVNAISQFWTVRQFLPSMIRRKHGHILIVASMAGRDTTQLITDYSSSKFAVHGFAEALSEDLRYMNVSGIDITTVYPLFVQTSMIADVAHRIQVKDGFKQNLTPQRVADAAVGGLLRRQRYVYVPGFMSLYVSISQMLPLKARRVLKDFMPTGFYEIDRTYD
jgi:all-trans-retinol dehydrogenase (NAD+)